jgi:integrase
MATIEEMKLLAKELAETKQADEASYQAKLAALGKMQVADLLRLREHWVVQYKKLRSLDDESLLKRKEASIWVKAIDAVLSSLGQAQGGLREEQPKDEPNGLSFREFADAYLEYVKNTFAAKTLENHARVMNLFADMFGAKDVELISLQDLENFKSKRKAKEVSPSTINIDIRTLKASFEWGVQFGKLSGNPLKKAKQVRVDQKAKSHLTDSEIEKLMAVVKEDWFKRLVQFAILTGLRRGELLDLKWSDFDENAGTITIQSSEEYRVKGGKTREIPLQEEALNILHSIQRQSDYIFTDIKGLQLDGGAVTKKFKRCVTSAGLSADLNFHSLRHTFATIASTKGVSMHILKKILGHSSVKTTETYTGTDQATIRDQMGRVTLSGMKSTGEVESDQREVKA